MESLAYTLIFLLRGRLPWQGFEVWSKLCSLFLLTAVTHLLGQSVAQQPIRAIDG